MCQKNWDPYIKFEIHNWPHKEVARYLENFENLLKLLRREPCVQHTYVLIHVIILHRTEPGKRKKSYDRLTA